MKSAACYILSMTIAALLSVRIGAWAINAAARSRGYVAVGGEYIFIPFMFFLLWFLSRELLTVIWNVTEEKLRRRKKRRTLIKKYQARSDRT